MKKVMITAYDYPTARIIESVGVDYILIGDSLAMVVLGHKDTKSVTMPEILHHTKAVCKGAPNSYIIGDMPINSYNTPQLALENAKKFIELGCKAVKIEGCKPEIIKALKQQNIEVVGHLGLLPQTAEKYCIQGKDKESADRIFNEAKILDELGIKLLVLECIPEELAKKITDETKLETIGIGCGKYCDGQVLVLHDILGLCDFSPKFAKQYTNITKAIKDAVTNYKQDVQEGRFP